METEATDQGPTVVPESAERQAVLPRSRSPSVRVSPLANKTVRHIFVAQWLLPHRKARGTEATKQAQAIGKIIGIPSRTDCPQGSSKRGDRKHGDTRQAGRRRGPGRATWGPLGGRGLGQREGAGHGEAGQLQSCVVSRVTVSLYGPPTESVHPRPHATENVRWVRVRWDRLLNISRSGTGLGHDLTLGSF